MLSQGLDSDKKAILICPILVGPKEGFITSVIPGYATPLAPG